MSKLDLRKELAYLYAPSAKIVEIVEVPAFYFVMVNGRIEPGTAVADAPDFHEAMKALYGISFTLKFMSKLSKQNPVDYSVMAIEGLWWLDSGEFELDATVPWNFTLMMLQPEHITPEMYLQAVAQVKKKSDSPLLSQVRFEPFHEGLCIQTMHIGPYSSEPATIDRMKSFANENGLRYRGLHHEIYLGDPRRAKPEKLRTILRQPVERAQA